jgi:MCP family monocarboxylic acid transporter-like MFS transporter 10
MGGVILPLILPFLMEKFGIANTLRIVSIGIGVSLICVLPFIRGRLPESRVHGPGARRLMDPAWKSSPTFWALMCANTIQSLAYFVPIVVSPESILSLPQLLTGL